MSTYKAQVVILTTEDDRDWLAEQASFQNPKSLAQIARVALASYRASVEREATERGVPVPQVIHEGVTAYRDRVERWSPGG